MPVRVTVLIAGLVALAVAILAYITVRMVQVPLHAPTFLAWLLAGLILVGEAYPIVIPRGEVDDDAVTVSATFVMALTILGPIWLVIPAQAVAAFIDDIRRRKSLRKVVFNIAQLVISSAAARGVYGVLSGQGLVQNSMPVQVRDLWAALVAGLVFFICNNGLTGTVVAMAGGSPILRHLASDVRFNLSTSGILLSFAPVVVVASDFSLLLLPLMVLPIYAVFRSARLAGDREQQALHDGLTGLPNRLLIRDRAARILADAERTGAQTAILLIDLDHFKEINDTLGHYVGDQLIREVGARLQDALREGDTIARLGGDEFAVLACNLVGPEQAELVADRLLNALAMPMIIEGVRLDVQGSIGITIAPLHGNDIETLMQRADVALYAAKESRGCSSLYQPAGDLHSVEKLALLGELREGIASGQLRVHYQPKCDTRTGTLLGLEALVRWEHPGLGLVYPDEFIGIAENTGLIGALTDEVLRQSLMTARRLRQSGHYLSMAVNLSVRLLTDLDLPSRIAGLLGTYGLPPEVLTLEVTETSIMVDPVRTMTVLGLLRDLGVTLSIDDFGTGYSSLAYLKRLQADELKMDRSFVMLMASNSDDAVIVRSTIELGHNLGLRIVAEGVEDAATWSMLQALGCDQIQGYFLSRPLSESALDAFLASYVVREVLPVAM